MKSDVMLSDDDEEEPEEDELEPAPPWEEAWEGESGEGPQGDPIAALENEMDRRLDRKTARGTPMTLDELVRDLRNAERGTWWKESRSYDTTNSPQGFSRGVQTLDYRSGDDMRMEGEPDTDDVTGTTHKEDIDALIEAVWAELELAYSRGRTEVLFAEVEDAAGSRIESFLALLFLAHRGDVFLQQDELFGDLWIIDPDADPDFESQGIATDEADGEQKSTGEADGEQKSTGEADEEQ